MAASQLAKQARIIIAEYVAQCGLGWHCTRVFVRPGLRTKRGPAWATIHTTGDKTFVLYLDRDMDGPNAPALRQIIGHEIGHMVLDRCQLEHDTEERICDLIGNILAH